MVLTANGDSVRTVPVCGLPVAVLDYAGAVEAIFGWARRQDRAYAVEAANTHVAALARRDEEFGSAMSRFDLVCPDGMPLVWAANYTLSEDDRMKDRVYGPTLMLRAIEASEKEADIGHFFLGGMESTLESLENRFSEDHPNARLAGSYSPPFGEWPEAEFERICDHIRQSGANIVWVGLGCPKQEKWIAKNLDRLPPAVYLGIGAAFAFHAGEVSQAPMMLQRIGMEWLYRLLMEPRRLFRRYLVNNTLFVTYWVKDTMRGE